MLSVDAEGQDPLVLVRSGVGPLIVGWIYGVDGCRVVRPAGRGAAVIACTEH